MTKRITKDQLSDLLENEDTIELSSSPTKHDISLTTCIVSDDGKKWKVFYEASYNNGIMGDDFTMQEVEPYEVTVTKWRAVK